MSRADRVRSFYPTQTPDRIVESLERSAGIWVFSACLFVFVMICVRNLAGSSMMMCYIDDCLPAQTNDLCSLRAIRPLGQARTDDTQ